jgi:hypothetical protein
LLVGLLPTAAEVFFRRGFAFVIVVVVARSLLLFVENYF